MTGTTEHNHSAGPSIMDLWRQAGGGTKAYSRERYRELMLAHGHLLRPGDDGYEEATNVLPCGWHGEAPDVP